MQMAEQRKVGVAPYVIVRQHSKRFASRKSGRQIARRNLLEIGKHHVDARCAAPPAVARARRCAPGV